MEFEELKPVIEAEVIPSLGEKYGQSITVDSNQCYDAIIDVSHLTSQSIKALSDFSEKYLTFITITPWDQDTMRITRFIHKTKES